MSVVRVSSFETKSMQAKLSIAEMAHHYRRASAPPVVTVWSSNQEPVVIARPRRSTVAAMSKLTEWNYGDTTEPFYSPERRGSTLSRKTSMTSVGSKSERFFDFDEEEVQEEEAGLASHVRFIIPDKLAFVSLGSEDLSELKEQIRDANQLKFVSSKLHQTYFPLCGDFGPVDLSIVYRFCKLIRKALNNEASTGRVLVYCIETDEESRANAAFLLASFLLLDLGCSPELAASHFEDNTAPFTLTPFRDATHMEPDYDLTLRDCLDGLARATSLKWFDMATFDLEQYEYLFDSQNGDITQVCPKFVAFKGPLSRGSRYRVADEIAFPPLHYAPAFREMGVTAVVRLNEPDTYDATEFVAAGIRHYDLFFTDCTVPPPSVVDEFLSACDQEGGVAVHCRAGLGRTGTLIAVWMMQRQGFTANEAIAWLRLVRPGSVIGPQQHFLRDCEAEFRKTPPAVHRSGLGEGGLGSCGGSAEAYEALAAERAEQVQRGLLKKSARAAAAAADGRRPEPPAAGYRAQ